jgi:hypothetical protein
VLERLAVCLAHPVFPAHQAAHGQDRVSVLRNQAHQARVNPRLPSVDRFRRGPVEFLHAYLQEALLDPDQPAQAPLQEGHLIHQKLFQASDRLVEREQVFAEGGILLNVLPRKNHIPGGLEVV